MYLHIIHCNIWPYNNFYNQYTELKLPILHIMRKKTLNIKVKFILKVKPLKVKISGRILL